MRPIAMSSARQRRHAGARPPAARDSPTTSSTRSSSCSAASPTELELAMYAVMWSEHCSYKSSQRYLGRFPTEAPWVLVGPGEGAGVIDVGDGLAVAIRIESHNHPSAVEPYQGAATGVGGIIRDIFSMGARPIALMDPLRFGPLDDARTRYLARGRGRRHQRLRQRGRRADGRRRGRVRRVLPRQPARQRAVPRRAARSTGSCSAQAEGVGNLAVLLGSSTGRDGIGGASVLASAGFRRGPTRPSGRRCRWATRSRRSGSSRPASSCSTPASPSACRTSAAPGISCAASETAAQDRRGHGRRRRRACPQREPGMNAVRGDDVREPGAHARDRHARRTSTRCCDLRAAGRSGPRSSAGVTDPAVPCVPSRTLVSCVRSFSFGT